MSALKFNKIGNAAAIIAFTLLLGAAIINANHASIIKEIQGTYQACWKQWKVIENLEERDKCANTCAMEEMGWFTENRQLNVRRAMGMVREYFGNDEPAIQLANVVFDDCSALPLLGNDKCADGHIIAACVKRDLARILNISVQNVENYDDAS